MPSFPFYLSSLPIAQHRTIYCQFLYSYLGLLAGCSIIDFRFTVLAISELPITNTVFHQPLVESITRMIARHAFRRNEARSFLLGANYKASEVAVVITFHCSYS